MKMEYQTIYDISLTLGQELVDYPGDTPFLLERVATISEQKFNLSKIVMSAHSGTHMDAPSHFIREGQSIDTFTPENFITQAQVVEISGVEAIMPEDLKGITFRHGEAIIFKTDNSKIDIYKNKGFTERFSFLTEEAAVFCVEKKVPLVGFDYITIERSHSQDFVAHHTFLRNNVLILEGLKLSHVPPRGYTLICLPLKIKGSEASPVRAVLLR